MGTGSEQEAETLIPELEQEPVTYAAFDPPTGDRPGGREAAQLLRDALRLSLRRGAGPFRGAGRINFEPRAYQLAPLMMALRQETVRLLIADDVGIGKTIEAGLILREYIDRDEIDRFCSQPDALRELSGLFQPRHVHVGVWDHRPPFSGGDDTVCGCGRCHVYPHHGTLDNAVWRMAQTRIWMMEGSYGPDALPALCHALDSLKAEIITAISLAGLDSVTCESDDQSRR